MLRVTESVTQGTIMGSVNSYMFTKVNSLKLYNEYCIDKRQDKRYIFFVKRHRCPRNILIPPTPITTGGAVETAAPP